MMMNQYKVHNMMFIYYTNYLPHQLRLSNIEGYFTLGTESYMGHSIQQMQIFFGQKYSNAVN